MNTLLIPVIAGTLVFLAVMLASVVVVDQQRRASTRRSLAIVLRVGAIKAADGELVDGRRGGTLASAVSAVGARVVGQRNRASLREHLAWAGKPTADDLRSAVDRKIVYGALGLFLGALFAARVGGVAWIALPAAAVFGYFLPDILAYNQGLKRTEQIQLGLPDALDLLDLCVESGLSMQAALARVAEHQSGPVAAEFGRVLQEMQLGLSRADAFEALARRTKQEDMHRFVAAILQVDKLGIPVAAVLKEQAVEMRKKRQSRAREQAQKVPVKILGPLLLCFLPGLFIIILGPAIVTVADVFLRG
jgi:tight adherence protein C